MVPGKLTYLLASGVLVGSFVSSGAFGYSGYIQLWDPRSGEVVWETNEPGSGRSSRFGDAFSDVDVDTEDSTLLKVFCCLGNSVASTRFMLQDEFNIQTFP